jgi:uncharacterized protein YqhQ
MKYSLLELYKKYNKNKVVIDAYIRGEQIENFSTDLHDTAGTEILLIILFFYTYLAIWVWACVALYRNWDKISTVGKVLGIIGLLPVIPGGHIFTLLVAYL